MLPVLFAPSPPTPDELKPETDLLRLLGPSKLPAVGTTIFTVMSQLAQEHRAVNLGQGFPDFDCEPQLKALVSEAMQQGHNRSEEHTSELQSRPHLVCRLLLEKKKKQKRGATGQSQQNCHEY